MKSIFDNLNNGNLTDAKNGAKRFSGSALFFFAIDNLDMTVEKANASAKYLKNLIDFQNYCDTV